MTLRNWFARFVTALTLVGLAAGAAFAGEDLWAVTTSNNLINFNSDDPVDVQQPADHRVGRQ